MTRQNMLVTSKGFVPMTTKQTLDLCENGVISAIHQEEDVTYFSELDACRANRALDRVLDAVHTIN